MWISAIAVRQGGEGCMLYLWIALGSALGGMARFWCTGVVAQPFGETFPWGTLVVNVLGSLIIGFFATLTGARRTVVRRARRSGSFVMVGFCGGYTTFSSFSLQTLNLARDGEWLQAGANIRPLRRRLPCRRLARPRRGRASTR